MTVTIANFLGEAASRSATFTTPGSFAMLAGSSMLSWRARAKKVFLSKFALLSCSTVWAYSTHFKLLIGISVEVLAARIGSPTGLGSFVLCPNFHRRLRHRQQRRRDFGASHAFVYFPRILLYRCSAADFRAHEPAFYFAYFECGSPSGVSLCLHRGYCTLVSSSVRVLRLWTLWASVALSLPRLSLAATPGGKTP